MANYSASNGFSTAGTLQAITSTYKSLITLTASSATALRRFKIYDITFGTLGTPADQTYEWDVSRTTVLGTGGSTIVAAPLDPADGVARTIATANLTGEGTYTAATSMFYLGTNQRASYRWVCAPGSELVAPATDVNGFGMRTRSVSGGTATATTQMWFQEQ